MEIFPNFLHLLSTNLKYKMPEKGTIKIETNINKISILVETKGLIFIETTLK